MRNKGWKMLAVGLMALTVGTVLYASRVHTSAQSGPDKELAGYRSWTRVNQTPRRSNNFLIDGQDA